MKQPNSTAQKPVSWKFAGVIIVFVCCCFQDSFCQQYRGTFTGYSAPHLRLNEVSTSAYRHFRDNFKTVSNEEWIKDDDAYVAKFTEGIVRNRVYYDKHGEFQYARKAYGPELLDQSISNSVYDKFGGYTIKTVTEFSDLESMEYFIVIENRKSEKQIEYSNGKITIIEEYVNGGM